MNGNTDEVEAQEKQQQYSQVIGSNGSPSPGISLGINFLACLSTFFKWISCDRRDFETLITKSKLI